MNPLDHKSVVRQPGVGVLEGLQETTLASREAVIEQGLGTFVEVGNALLAIREDRQYIEAGFPNFEAYCQRRWNFSRQTGYDLMQTAAVAQLVQEVGQQPSREAARELAPLRAEPEKVKAAWAESVELHGPTPTAAQVREVVQGDPAEKDPATKWFEAGAKAQRDRVSEMYRLHDGAKPCRKVDWDLLGEQVVRMDKLERQLLSGSADTFERAARQIRQLLETKLEVVK